MNKTYRISYRLYGSIDVKASSPDEAEDIVKGIIVEGADEITDRDLYEGINKAGVLGHPDFNIDGDAIEVILVEGEF